MSIQEATRQTQTAIQPGTAVIPYLPSLLSGDAANYHHHVQLRPLDGEQRAGVTFDRFAWATEGTDWRLVQLEPLTLTAAGQTPFLVVGPLSLNPECPQLWSIRDAENAALLISAVSRREGLPSLQLMPGVAPPVIDAPHTMSLPDGVELPDIRKIVPCRLDIYPLSPFVSIAVRFRVYEFGRPVADSPYLFRSAITSPRSWEVRNGRRILEEDPNTGRLQELVEATPSAGRIAPAVTVFSGRMLATFSWRVTDTSFSVAGLVPGETNS